MNIPGQRMMLTKNFMNPLGHKYTYTHTYIYKHHWVLESCAALRWVNDFVKIIQLLQIVEKYRFQNLYILYMNNLHMEARRPAFTLSALKRLFFNIGCENVRQICFYRRQKISKHVLAFNQASSTKRWPIAFNWEGHSWPSDWLHEAWYWVSSLPCKDSQNVLQRREIRSTVIPMRSKVNVALYNRTIQRIIMIGQVIEYTLDEDRKKVIFEKY